MKKICKLRSLETSYKNQVELFFSCTPNSRQNENIKYEISLGKQHSGQWFISLTYITKRTDLIESGDLLLIIIHTLIVIL